MQDQPQNTPGPLPSEPLSPAHHDVMPEIKIPPMMPPTGPSTKPMMPMERPSMKHALPDMPKHHMPMSPTMSGVIMLTILTIIGFLVLYFRVDSVTQQVTMTNDKSYAELEKLSGKTDTLISADAQRNAAVTKVKTDLASTGVKFKVEGDALIGYGTQLVNRGNAIKASEATKTDKALADTADGLIKDGTDMIAKGEGWKLEGQSLIDANETNNGQ